MANRAYLFCSDADPNDPFTWVKKNSNDQIYYDSRHNIPLSWFFFFKPHQVKLVDIILANGYLKNVDYWQEPKFMADKAKALDTFRSRETHLARIVGPGLHCPAFEHFLPRIESLPGNCLCMDPREIAQDDEDDFLPFKHILELIDDKASPLDFLQKALSQFSRIDYKDEDALEVNVFGYTYGDFAPGTFSRAI